MIFGRPAYKRAYTQRDFEVEVRLMHSHVETIRAFRDNADRVGGWKASMLRQEADRLEVECRAMMVRVDRYQQFVQQMWQ